MTSLQVSTVSTKLVVLDFIIKISFILFGTSIAQLIVLQNQGSVVLLL